VRRKQMSSSDFQENPDAPGPEADPYLSVSGPTDYEAVPWYRRNGFCSGIIVAHLIIMFLGGCVPLLSLLGVFTTIGVIAVCIVVLTGPVYYNKRRKDGTLKSWSGANKVAAVILLVLFICGYSALIYFLASSGRFG
jgi:hypothetical protein